MSEYRLPNGRRANGRYQQTTPVRVSPGEVVVPRKVVVPKDDGFGSRMREVRLDDVLTAEIAISRLVNRKNPFLDLKGLDDPRPLTPVVASPDATWAKRLSAELDIEETKPEAKPPPLRAPELDIP